jgi:L-seryl-tRNA(Ser) seleniumtransferase
MKPTAATDRLRDLPSVDEVVLALRQEGLMDAPHSLLVKETRRAIAAERKRLLDSGDSGAPADITALVRAALEQLRAPSLRRVINATGVVLHTNLGRAPLAPFDAASGYSNLEYDIASGRRGKRDVHAGALLERVLGKPAIAVNNGAAAVYLALHELAAGGEVIVSRGELIEIGDGFRIPDIMARSGAVLREVGTTNRTRIEDYRAAITDRTRLLMRVHPSNFHISGFTSKPRLDEIPALGRERGIPVYEDLGSGCVVDLRPFGVTEPLVQESLEAGVNVVSFSGDKLLGGPQAGLLAGDAELVARLRRNPMFRALRLDKLILAALETTLRHVLFEEWEAIPALQMIRASGEELRERALRFVEAIAPMRASVVEGRSVIGGGSTPDQSLPAWLVVLEEGDAVATERRLRLGNPPVIARIESDRVVLDLRTVSVTEVERLTSIVGSLSR